MPIIQRRRLYFEGKEFVCIVKVSADGEFSAALPPPVAEMFDHAIVSGTTKEAVMKSFDTRLKEYSDRKSSTKKVILFEVYDKISFADGIALAIAAQEYFETRTETEQGPALFDYKEITSFDEGGRELDTKLQPRSRGGLSPRGRTEAKNKIDWTPERVVFLNKIATALKRIKTELAKLQEPEDMARIADSGRLLLINK